MAKEKVNIDEFLTAINNLLSSKYILVDRRISDILLSIADTSAVYNLIAECMINFDFRSEWNLASQGAFLKFPETDAKKISFIFCLLNNIDDGNLDITRILERYFSYSTEISPYELFCRDVITQFRNLIVKNLGEEIETQNTSEFSENEMNETTSQDDFDVLSNMLYALCEDVKNAKKLKKCFMQKQDIVAVISSFEQASTARKVEYFYGFMVTLKAALGKNKNFQNAVSQIVALANDLILRR